MKLETHIEHKGYIVTSSKDVSTGEHDAKGRCNKANKIVRCSAIADKLPEQFMRTAFKAKRADRQREERRAKR